MNSVVVSEKKYCSLIAYLLLKPKSHIYHSCLINLFGWNHTNQMRQITSKSPDEFSPAVWQVHMLDLQLKWSIFQSPCEPSTHLSIYGLILYSVHPSFESNRRCGMNLNDTWSSHRRVFGKVSIAAAFLFPITCFIWFVVFVAGKTS